MKTLLHLAYKLILAVVLAITSCIVVWLAPGDYNHDLAALVNKRDLLRSKKSPRVIFIGGSSLITLHSAHIEKKLNENADIRHSIVNLGLWGGLSMQTYLDEIKPFLRPGDIVILSQEYATLLDKNYFTYIHANQEGKNFFFLISPGKHLVHYYQKGDLIEPLKIIIMLNQLKIKTCFHTVIDCNWSHRITGGFYRYVRDYNSYGDRRSSFRVVRPLNSTGALFQKPDIAKLAYIKHFSDYARTNDILLFFSFPPFPDADYRLNKIQILELYSIIRNTFMVSILNGPEETVFPESCFADTVNHLKPECENFRTEKVLKRLKNAIQ
ncbi:MAG: hypothetical protein JW807_01285 [Spirochaetes bacterium]|nr:hypothetical protein [Spirochaetota bacterium]